MHTNVYRGYAWLLVRLRWLVLPACLLAAIAAVGLLPGLHAVSALGRPLSIVPSGAAPRRTEVQVLREFGLPLLGRTMIVVRDPGGLSLAEQANVAKLVADVDMHKLPDSVDVAGALPVPNTLQAFPSSSERGTAVVIYLFFPLDVSVTGRTGQAHYLVRHYLQPTHGAYVGVTGAATAEEQQGNLAESRLIIVQIAAALVIALIVAFRFRCLGAPLVALATAIAAYESAVHVIGWVGERFGGTVPGQLEPLIAVLVAGVCTDYSIFYLSAFRDRLREYPRAREAAEQAITGITPVVLAAGLSVVAGTATLSIAHLQLFRDLGPGMALSVVVSVIAATVFLPALLACAGRAVFWPGRAPHPEHLPGAPSDPERAGLRRRALGPLVAHRSLGALVLLITVAVLAIPAVIGVSRMRTGTDLIADLPGGSEPAAAAQQAGDGFAPGIIAPTEILVRGNGLDARRAALDRLQRLIGEQDHVAGVVGPADVPVSGGHDVLITSSGSAARYMVILDQRPYGGPAIGTAKRLASRLPALLSRAGLHGADAHVTGDSALSASVTTTTTNDLVRVGELALAVLLVILCVFLRSLLAPILLLAATLLSVLATLGLMTLLYQDGLGAPSLTYYVPFAVTILLLCFGSDYNIFLVGRIWQHSPAEPFRRRVLDGASHAGGAITTAGITLALSFALLAIVPVAAFREFAFGMVAGVLIDTFVVRSIMVPALFSLLGPVAGWPSKRLRQRSRHEL